MFFFDQKLNVWRGTLCCNFKEMTNGLNLKEGVSYLMLSVSKKGHNPERPLEYLYLFEILTHSAYRPLYVASLKLGS